MIELIASYLIVGCALAYINHRSIPNLATWERYSMIPLWPLPFINRLREEWRDARNQRRALQRWRRIATMESNLEVLGADLKRQLLQRQELYRSAPAQIIGSESFKTIIQDPRLP